MSFELYGLHCNGCVLALCIAVQSAVSESDVHADADDDSATGCGSLLLELPSMFQVYRLMALSGPAGIDNQTLQSVLGFSNKVDAVVAADCLSVVQALVDAVSCVDVRV